MAQGPLDMAVHGPRPLDGGPWPENGPRPVDGTSGAGTLVRSLGRCWAGGWGGVLVHSLLDGQVQEDLQSLFRWEGCGQGGGQGPSGGSRIRGRGGRQCVARAASATVAMGAQPVWRWETRMRGRLGRGREWMGWLLPVQMLSGCRGWPSGSVFRPSGKLKLARKGGARVGERAPAGEGAFGKQALWRQGAERRGTGCEGN